MTSPDDKQSDKAKRSEGAGAARLRNKIYRGGAGDKVAFPDPAAAPLGTDDEAAGHPPTRAQLRRAQAQELGRAEGQTDRPSRRRRQSPHQHWLPAMIVGLVLLVGLIVALVLIPL